MAPHSSALAWKIPWMEELGRLQSMRSLRVGHDWATSLSLFTSLHWRRKWPLPQCSCLENPRDSRAWWAAVYGVAQSRTRLKRLSSSHSSIPSLGFPGGTVVMSPPANTGDTGSTSGSGRSPGVGNSNPLEYSCLENSMARRAWWATVHGVTKSQTWLSDWTHIHIISLGPALPLPLHNSPAILHKMAKG